MRVFYKIFIFILLIFLPHCSMIKQIPNQRLADLHVSQQDFAHKIGIIQPAAPINASESNMLMENKKWSFANNLQDNVKLTVDNDKERFEKLLLLLNNPNLDYLWAVRGGYGSARLYPYLARTPNLSEIVTNKVIIGYSDITFLHLLWNKYGGKSIHASMLKEIYDTNKNIKNFDELNFILANKTGEIEYSNLTLLNEDKIGKKAMSKLSGEVIGGNLTIITNSLATAWKINAKNKILLLEDVNCLPHVLDRDLLHLKQAGVLKNVKALILGDFTAKDPAAQQSINNILMLFAKDQSVPLFLWPEFGHGPRNRAIPLGFIGEITQEEAVSNLGETEGGAMLEDSQANALVLGNPGRNSSTRIALKLEPLKYYSMRVKFNFNRANPKNFSLGAQ